MAQFVNRVDGPQLQQRDRIQVITLTGHSTHTIEDNLEVSN